MASELERLERENVKKLEQLVNIIHARIGSNPANRRIAEALAYLKVLIAADFDENPINLKNESRRDRIYAIVLSNWDNEMVGKKLLRRDPEWVTTTLIKLGVGK